MVIIKQELKKFGSNGKKDIVYAKLYADEAPNSLQLTGEDLGIAGEILPGSMLLTPTARYVYGENGEFIEMEGGGSAPVAGMDWGDVFTREWSTDLVIDFTEKSKKNAFITGNRLFTGTASTSGPLTSITFKANSDQMAYIAEDCFKYNKNLSQINFEGDAGVIYDNAFLGCEVTGDVIFGKVVSVRTGAFESFNCSKIKIGEITTLYSDSFKAAMFSEFDAVSISFIYKLAFENCTNLTAFVIRSGTTSLNNASAFTGTPIASGTGYIYVPADLVDTYKAATNWSTYAAQIRALESYTVDGTTTGDLDPAKI